MMSIIKSKKGIGLPTVLGIVTFVIATVATLLTVAVAQAKLMDKSIESSETYANAVQAVDATLKIIFRDQDLDPAYLSALETYMGVTIEVYGTNLYMISSMVTSTKSIVSYFTNSAVPTSIYDQLLSKTGQEPDFVLSPLITPTTMLASFLPTFISTSFPWITPQTEFTTFSSIVSYIGTLASTNNGFIQRTPAFLLKNLTVTGSWYVNGNVTVPKDKNITVLDNRLLIINGNLTVNDNCTITGNIIVNGNLAIKGKKTIETIRGTLYVNGDVDSDKDLQLGISTRPAFIFAENNVSLGDNYSGFGYFLCANFSGQQGNNALTGGIYTSGSASLPPAGITPQTDLNQTLFYTYGIPETISIESGGSPGSGSFVYTSPKLT